MLAIVLGKAQYQPLSVLARTMGHDANYLGLLARQGKLEARRRAGRWYSTQAAVQRYTQQAEVGLGQRGRPRRSTREAHLLNDILCTQDMEIRGERRIQASSLPDETLTPSR